MVTDVTDFAYWQNETFKNLSKYMCMLCFEDFPLEELHMGNDGIREDVCIPCWESEDKEMKRRGLR